MAKFRKKPVVIEAFQLPPRGDFDLVVFEAWADESGFSEFKWTSERDETLAIETIEGVMTAQPGDWIIKSVKGEFYPCKPDIFAATYQSADTVEEEKPLLGLATTRELLAEISARIELGGGLYHHKDCPVHTGYHSLAALPKAEVETHEFAQGVIPNKCNLAFCGQPADAPVHKVESEPYIVDDGTGMTLAIEATEPPARVWISPSVIKLIDRRAINVYLEADKEPDDIEFAHLAPIQAALEVCEYGIKTMENYVAFRKSDWNALVKSVKGKVKS